MNALHRKSWRSFAGTMWLAVLAPSVMTGLTAEPTLSPRIDFNTQIRPLISAKCFACHGPDEESRKAKLRLDLREEAIRDRDGTRVIAPGDPAQSELLARVTSTDEDEVMPPPKHGHPVTAEQAALLRQWITEGAEYRPHWAFAKPVRPAPPALPGSSWPRNAVDRFILQKLQEHGLEPSQEADAYTLIRRLSLDLTGLPPSPSEAEAFVQDRSEDAYERLVDRLLASAAYGERWARVWLDLARYADSAGYGSDPLRLNIWPWRDWVIRALNRNLPYDQFTVDQIAGDLLPGEGEDERIATAFHRNTMTNTEGGTDDEEYRVAAVKDRANVTAQVWMGLTMGCAQCHTHKFDPITHREYYQFFALFNQTEDNDQPDERPTLPLPNPDQRRQMKTLEAEIAELETRRRESTPELKSELAAWESQHAKGIDWGTLKPARITTLHGDPMEPSADGFIPLAAADSETFTARVQTPPNPLTALRIEVFPGATSGGGDEARASGLWMLNEIELSVRDVDAPTPRPRYIRVELPGSQRILSLAEVQIFDDSGSPLSGGQATQSSVAQGAGASRAIDGRSDGDFEAGSTTLTGVEDNPWWEVDLGAETPVGEIAVWNRTDRGLGTRLTDFKVMALDPERKPIWEKTIGPAPGPVVRLRLPAEKRMKLVNASARTEASDHPAPRAIDGKTDAASGWGFEGVTDEPQAISFELENAVVGKPGSWMIFTLTAKRPEAHDPGRLRISATDHPLPVRETPESIRALLGVDPSMRTGEQQAALEEYFIAFAESEKPIREALRAKRKELDAIQPVALPVLRELASDKRRATHRFEKGNFLAPAEPVEPGVPAAFHPLPVGAEANRLALARWLVDRENPLTARVAVNRLWAQVFGAGIVETEEDFGTQGTLPSHPELLDWLAVEFMENGWDMKAILKQMVMSATYRQSSRTTPELLEKDPLNRLCSRGSRRRLDAEMVRDQALALSGLLSRKLGGPSVYPWQPDGLWRAAFNGERTWATSEGEDRHRRGLYTFWRRTIPYPSMATFDAPSRETCTVRRTPTNTPLQAFVTMNDPVYVEASQALARRLITEGGAAPADRVRYGLRLCLGRPPDEAQVAVLIELFEKELAHYKADNDAALKLATEPIGPLPEGWDSAETAAWTSVANVLLNLDGVLTRS